MPRILFSINIFSTFVIQQSIEKMTLHPKYIIDETGNKSAVVLPIKEYDKLIEELEDIEDIRLYDEGKADKSPSIPIDEAFKLIEAKRRKK
jgi:hypothetical protein